MKEDCFRCRGSGRVQHPSYPTKTTRIVCHQCGGAGWLRNESYEPDEDDDYRDMDLMWPESIRWKGGSDD